MFEKVSHDLVEHLGGKQNIKTVNQNENVFVFNVKDPALVRTSDLLHVSGVSNINYNSLGIHVSVTDSASEVYDSLIEYLDSNDDGEQKKEKLKEESLFNRGIKAITASLSPVVPVMAGAGLGKVIVLVLELAGILTKTHPVHIFLSFIFDTAYFFLPAYTGFSAAKVFGANQYLGGFMGLMTVHPTWMNIIADGIPFTFLGLNVPLINYKTTLIPALVTVWLMSYIEKFFRKVVPDMMKVFGVPLMTMLVTAPLTFLVFGPLGDWISQLVADGSVFLYDTVGFIAIPLLAAAYPWLVSIGVHKALSPISITLVAEQGFDPIIRVVALCANMSQAAAGLFVGFRAKDKELKSLAYSTSLTAFLGGTTGPVMYGVNLPLKKPMIASMVGAFAGGVFASLAKMKAFIYVTPALLSLPMWISENENYLLQAVITIIITTTVTFIVQALLGFDETDYNAKN